MAENLMNIYQKLAKIRKHVEVMKRNTSGYGFKYTNEESILAKITVFMEKYDLSLVPGIVQGTTVVEPYSYKKTKTTAKGVIYEENVNDVLVYADTTWTWVNNESPDERVVVPWSMVGQQSDASQSFGSGLTYSSRYFLLKYFNISTSNDDPDAFRKKQKEAEAEEDALIASQILQSVDTYIKNYLGSHSEKREEIIQLVKKYVKSGDYFLIKESALAAKLLQDIENNFKEEE